MGLIQAGIGAVGGVLADQWKEYFYCDAMPADVLAVKGKKRVSGRSSNTKGHENIISSGSVIAVATGQCMLIVEQGKIVEVCAEPGEFVFDSSTEPSVFAGNLGESILEVFKKIGKNFTFGGQPANDQRVYYINIKELIGNKYGTPSPVPFRVVDERAGIDMDIGIRCFGEYSYKIANPLLFYTNVCGNVAADYARRELDSQLKTELLTALQPAFAKLSDMGLRYSSLPGHADKLAKALNEVLSEKWGELRGIEIVSLGISSLSANEEDERVIKEMQKNAAFRDPSFGVAYMVGSTGASMQAAANNAGGAAMGFMGMNMAQTAGSIQGLYGMMQPTAQTAPAAPAAPAAPSADSWKCPACGATVTGKFCTECGAKKPETAAGWTCKCGAVNKGKFCSECGEKKPAGEPLYQCDKCGWEPEDPKHPPKFCPECGDPFTDADIR